MLIHNFLIQLYAHFYTVDKAGSLMIPAKGTDRINNFVHVSQGHPIHKAVQFIEILFDLLIVIPLQIDIAFIE